MAPFWYLIPRLLLACLLSQAHGEPLICQQDWQFPIYPDYTTTVLVGRKYTLQWDSNLKNWFSSWCEPCGDPSKVDLWVQTGHNEDSQYKIASGVNVNTTLSYPWTVNVGLRNATDDSIWVLRFVKFNGTPNNISGDSISSPLFKIKLPAGVRPSSSSSLSIAASSTGMKTSTPSTKTPQDKNLSTATREGIGVGIGVAALVTIACCCYIYLKRRKRRQQQTWYGEIASSEKDGSRGHSATYEAVSRHTEPAQCWDWSTLPDGGFRKDTSRVEMSSDVHRSELPVHEHASELSIERRL